MWTSWLGLRGPLVRPVIVSTGCMWGRQSLSTVDDQIISGYEDRRPNVRPHLADASIAPLVQLECTKTTEYCYHESETVCQF